MQDSPSRVVIIGVGLLGGSIGATLRKVWPGVTVVGVARQESTRKAALESGVVTEATSDFEAACENADWVFVCTPVSSIAAIAIRAAQVTGEETVITDVGSTKEGIVMAVEADPIARKKFVGSHPIAGSEKSGPQHARDDLLEGKTVIVTSTDHTDSVRLGRTKDLWERLGASVAAFSPAEHDRLFATASHVPHLVAVAVAASLTEDMLQYVGSGWRDLTRIAAGDPKMWTDICQENGAAILESLGTFSAELAKLEAAIGDGDWPGVENLFRHAKGLRDRVD